MTARRFLIAYAIAAVVFLALDALWLATMAEHLYRPAIGHLMRARFDIVPAVAFYVIYIAGVVIFAVAPALADGRAALALWRGGLLGCMAYATYDLTNQATLDGWPWAVTAADLCWGTLATAVAAVAAAALGQRIR